MEMNILWSKSSHFRVVLMQILKVMRVNVLKFKLVFKNAGENILTGCKTINSSEFNWAVQLLLFIFWLFMFRVNCFINIDCNKNASDETCALDDGNS